jgi:hypothetical protein
VSPVPIASDQLSGLSHLDCENDKCNVCQNAQRYSMNNLDETQEVMI